MATVSTLVEAVAAALVAALPEIDDSNTAEFYPAVTSQSVALVATALGHVDDGYFYSAGWMHVVHRLRIELWTKLDQGDIAACVVRARDLGYRAMRALVAADVTGGYTLAGQGDGVVMTYQVEPTVHVVNEIPYIRATLTVPVMQKEVV